MAGTTTIGIPYPTGTDSNNVPSDMLALANWLDPVIEGSYTQAEINAFSAAQKWQSRRVWNSTSGCFQWYDLGTTTWRDEQGVIINAQTASYTLVMADAFSTLIKLTHASVAITLSIPTDASVAFPVGTVIPIVQYGAAQVTVAAVTPGTTTVNGTPGLKLRTQYSTATLTKMAANEWLVAGDLTT